MMSLRHQTARTSLGTTLFNAPNDQPNFRGSFRRLRPRTGTFAATVAMEVGNVTTWIRDWSIWRMSREEPPTRQWRSWRWGSRVSKSVQPAIVYAKIRQQLQLALVLDPHTVLERLGLMSSSIQAQPSHEGVLTRPPLSRVAISVSPQNPIALDTDAFMLAALYPALFPEMPPLRPCRNSLPDVTNKSEVKIGDRTDRLEECSSLPACLSWRDLGLDGSVLHQPLPHAVSMSSALGPRAFYTCSIDRWRSWRPAQLLLLGAGLSRDFLRPLHRPVASSILFTDLARSSRRPSPNPPGAQTSYP